MCSICPQLRQSCSNILDSLALLVLEQYNATGYVYIYRTSQLRPAVGNFDGWSSDEPVMFTILCPIRAKVTYDMSWRLMFLVSVLSQGVRDTTPQLVSAVPMRNWYSGGSKTMLDSLVFLPKTLVLFLPALCRRSRL